MSRLDLSGKSTFQPQFLSNLPMTRFHNAQDEHPPSSFNSLICLVVLVISNLLTLLPADDLC